MDDPIEVSLLTNDSLKQEIKCYFWQLFQFPLKKNQTFGLSIDKVEHFSEKKLIVALLTTQIKTGI